jgi:WD repeat-containing protein 19
MRRDLLHWEQALNLAKKLAPEHIPYISREFAQQLEFKGDYKRALEMYQKGMSGEITPEHSKLCNAGVVTMTLRLGDVSKGISMAIAAADKQVFRDCGAILEGMKQFQEAAMLYEKGQQYDKAAGIYLQSKNYSLAAQLMDKITSPKLFKMYGQAMEDQKKYVEAEKAYNAAKDVDSVIRINLDYLQNIEKAFELVRQTRSQEGARLAAKFSQTKIGDILFFYY